MIRAHLIMNPEARRVTPALQRVIQAALEGRLKLDVVRTHARDSAIEAARDAVDSGSELLIAFGGDGLVNEVVNGMAGSDAALAVIPGGTMNVFARDLGIPADPLEAADHLLRRVGTAQPHRVVLGLANGRHFTFACGCGFDAEAAARVESHAATKRKYGQPYFYGAALATFLASYVGRSPYLRCEGSFGRRDGVLAIALVGGPYAYLGSWPVRLDGGRRPDAGLRVFLLRRLEVRHLPRYALGLFTGRFGPEASWFAGLDEVAVTAAAPLPYHVDGETVPPAANVDVRISPWRLRVLA